MDKSEAVRIATLYSDKVRKCMNVRKIILFGSQLQGTAREDSDIDIAVIMNGLGENYLDIATELYKIRSDVDINIEPVLLDEDHDRSGFIKEIIRTGMPIYISETL